MFNDMPGALKRLYVAYYHEKWLLAFEKIRKDFGVPYTYYIIPSGDGEYVYYVIDIERVSEEGQTIPEKLHLWDKFEEKHIDHRIMWETLTKKRIVSDCDVFENEYGKTYSYYLPFTPYGAETGVVCVDVDINDVNRDILAATLRTTGFVFFILVLSVIAVMSYINRRYIAKLVSLQENVKAYAAQKDAAIVDNIEKNVRGTDEIAVLSEQFAAMVREIDHHMEHVVAMSREIVATREHAEVMDELARTDSMTGIGNKMGYEYEVAKLERERADGHGRFGIAVADLNFLKKLNDTYGHEKGDLAICKLSEVLCRTFANSKVFRIGGDEFAVVMRGPDCGNAGLLLHVFRGILNTEKSDKPWEKISAAIGIAIYDKLVDEDINSLFRRADAAMYENKRAMKAVREE